jgi:hypothetical protein
MKIKLTCNWTDDKSLVERFNAAYITNENKNNNFEFTADDTFDFLCIINFSQKRIDFPLEKTVGVIMEPSWHPFSVNNKHFLSSQCRHVFVYDEEVLGIKNSIYYPGLLPFHMDTKNGDTLQYFVDTDFKKTKLCNIIVSNTNTFQPHESAIYPQRVKLVKEILNTDLDIDIYGNGWEQYAGQDKRIFGTVKNKKEALTDYQFSIAIENTTEPGYFTEKLTDVILTGSTPIYYGATNIHKFFNDIYILPSLNVDIIREIIKSKPLDQTKNKQLMSSKYNLYVALCKYFTKMYNIK